MSNTFTGSYLDGSPLTKALLDTAYQTLQLDIANTALTTTGSTTGQALLSNGSGIAASFQSIPDPQGPFSLRNYGLQATVASSVLTISLKSKAGTNPTATDAVNFNYSTNGTTTATYNTVNVTAATSISVNASATLGGHAGTGAQRVFVYGYYNTVTLTVKLAVSSSSYFDTGAKTTTVALSATADNANTLYATAALSVAPRLLGWLDSAFLSFGGDWQTPTRVSVDNNAFLTNQITAQYLRYVAIGQSSASTVTKAGVAVSTSCGNVTVNSSTATTITNLSVTITTSGRPVELRMMPVTGGTFPSTGPFMGVPTTTSLEISYVRDSTIISTQFYTNTTGSTLNFFPVGFLDVTVAGTYTYTAKARRINSNAFVNNFQLVAYEI